VCKEWRTLCAGLTCLCPATSSVRRQSEFSGLCPPTCSVRRQIEFEFQVTPKSGAPSAQATKASSSRIRASSNGSVAGELTPPLPSPLCLPPSLSLYIYVYIYTCIYVYTYIYIYIYIYTCIPSEFEWPKTGAPSAQTTKASARRIRASSRGSVAGRYPLRSEGGASPPALCSRQGQASLESRP